jgi:hypothetical protein
MFATLQMLWSSFGVMSPRALLTKIHRLQTKRDNIIFVLNYMIACQELSVMATVQLETQLSSVEDELVLLLSDKAA